MGALVANQKLQQVHHTLLVYYSRLAISSTVFACLECQRTRLIFDPWGKHWRQRKKRAMSTRKKHISFHLATLVKEKINGLAQLAHLPRENRRRPHIEEKRKKSNESFEKRKPTRFIYLIFRHFSFFVVVVCVLLLFHSRIHHSWEISETVGQTSMIVVAWRNNLTTQEFLLFFFSFQFSIQVD